MTGLELTGELLRLGGDQARPIVQEGGQLMDINAPRTPTHDLVDGGAERAAGDDGDRSAFESAREPELVDKRVVEVTSIGELDIFHLLQ